MSTKPPPAVSGPHFATLKADRRYLWCTCGRSVAQPFCDGSHAGTDFQPLLFKLRQDQDVVLCGCKRTGSPPFCDGSHNNLSATYKEAGADELRSAAMVPIVLRDRGSVGKSRLTDGCFVVTLPEDNLEKIGALRLASVINQSDGAEFISQFYAELDRGASGVLQFGDSAVVLFISGGAGVATVSGVEFPLLEETGLLVRPGEAFSLRVEGPAALRVLITACPQVPAPRVLDVMPGNFQASMPSRVAVVDPSLREPMADRFYQVLIGEPPETSPVTAFIGELPQSRAAAHRHLYEEAIMILSGEGSLWTEASRTTVQKGDILFLPRKILHSLECTSDSGMRLVGVFYPSGSPAVNF
jgi:CDGSH-type Zn-finger protein/quercetin dioxygenase-like cupin family protein